MFFFHNILFCVYEGIVPCYIYKNVSHLEPRNQNRYTGEEGKGAIIQNIYIISCLRKLSIEQTFLEVFLCGRLLEIGNSSKLTSEVGPHRVHFSNQRER